MQPIASKRNNTKNKTLTAREITVFAMLGALMFASRQLMSLLPNIHLIGTFIVAETLVFRSKALFPIYIFVFIEGLLAGFATWWLPYLYIWTVLWGFAMFVPVKKIPKKILPIVLAIACSLHGFLYGILYAPTQMLLYHMSFKTTVAWVIAGFPFDAVHGISNLVCGFLIIPLAKLIEKTSGIAKKQ